MFLKSRPTEIRCRTFPADKEALQQKPALGKNSPAMSQWHDTMVQYVFDQRDMFQGATLEKQCVLS